MGPYCGSSSPPTFTSVTNKLTLEFTSDVAMQAGGFEAEWSKVPMSGHSKVSQSSKYTQTYAYVYPIDNNVSKLSCKIPKMLHGPS